MLQKIRDNSQSVAAKIVVGVVVVVFAAFGIESIVGGLGGKSKVAVVNGDDITESSFLRAVDQKKRQILAQMGDKADPDLIDDSLLRKSVLDGLIDEQILAQDADSKGLYVADEMVKQYIRSIPQFNNNNQFNEKQFLAALQNIGLTYQEYSDGLKKQFVISQPRTAMLSSGFLLPEETDEIIAIDRQTRSFGVAMVYASDFKKDVVITDDQISQYYKANKASFEKPESVDVSYLEIKSSDLEDKIDVSDEEINNLYENDKASFVGEQERKASHILIKISDKRPEADALKLATELYDRIQKGEKFSDLAKKYSEDEGSASAGGDLGFAKKGVYVSDFENTLFALTKGEVSKPVKTEFGYHIIKLVDIAENEFAPLDELKDGLIKRIKAKKAKEEFSHLSERLADISYSSSDLAEPADELELTIKSLKGVSAKTGDPIFSNAKIQRTLFSDELVKDGNNSDVIQIAEGHSIVFHVDAYHPKAPESLEEVKDSIKEKLVKMESAKAAKEVGEAFGKRIDAGEDPQVVADDMGLEWNIYKDVKRDNVMQNPDVLKAVFSMDAKAANKIHGLTILDGDFAVIHLDSVAPGDPKSLAADERQALIDALSANIGASDYRSYQNKIKSMAQVEKL